MTISTQTLGPTDITIGRMSFGCWRFTDDSPDSPQARIEAALDLGMNLIDTADIYGFTTPVPGSDSDGFGGAEVLLGRVLKDAPHLRDQMVLATKGGIRPPVPYNSSKQYLTQALEASLTRLQTDHVDLYQIHRPDILTRFDDLAQTLQGFIQSGKVRHIGVSNFTNDQTRALAAALDAPIVTRQPQASLWHIDPIMNGTFDLCQEIDATPMAWSPLGGGLLATGQGEGLSEDMAERLRDVIKALDSMAQKYGATRTQMALAFLLAHPAGIVPIIGSQKINRLQEAAGASSVDLPREDWYALLVARRGEAMP